MTEELFVTARANELIDPGLQIWTWEVAMYLFLGGVTAGIMMFAAIVALMKKDEEAPFASDRLAILAPIVLTLGMTTLFMDLEHKLYVFRFYTTFKVLSPMSWGAWILLLVYPVAILQILSTVRRGVPQAAAQLDRFAVGRMVTDWCEEHRREISLVAVPIGALLGVYTAILLSAFSARPFWNTGVLAPLFLTSGLSTAAALVALLTKSHRERAWFTRIDVVLIIIELLLVGLFIINLATGSAKQIEALECCVMGGPYTFAFWVLFVGVGLLLPLLFELLEMRWRGAPLALAAAVLVLVGGYTLRHVMLEVGQNSTWTSYSTQYDSELLDRLETDH